MNDSYTARRICLLKPDTRLRGRSRFIAAKSRNLSKIPSGAKRKRGTLLANVVTHITPLSEL
jgi:hypothetical protein